MLKEMDYTNGGGPQVSMIFTVHEGAFYQLLVRLSSATSFEHISGNIDVPLGQY